jgi:hypothetical protein
MLTKNDFDKIYHMIERIKILEEQLMESQLIEVVRFDYPSPGVNHASLQGSRDRDVILAVREIMHRHIQQKIDDIKNSLLELGVNYDA